MTDQEAEQMRKQLAEHYGEPVYRMSQFCEKFGGWLDNAQAQHGLVPGQLDIAIAKSNFLYRLFYMDEPVRTEKCPKHHGHWSGMHFSDQPPCECTDRAGNITGWLPVDPKHRYNPVWVKAEGLERTDGTPVAMSVLVHRDP